MERSAVIGLLYPGEMGGALAGMLSAKGLRVVTTLQGRGGRTAGRCRELGLTVLDSLSAVAEEADVVISVVPPAAAAEVAAAYCEASRHAPPGALYVDANSIRPELARELASRLAACGRGFVDAAVNGLAANAAASGTLFLSGPRAGEVGRLFAGAIRVQELGDEPGRASAMKMLLGGLSKGLCALFLELALLADGQGMLEQMFEACGRIYPGVFAVAGRMLPTYPRHAARRATETAEVEQTVRAAGLEPCLTQAVRRMHETLAGVAFEAPAGGEWTLASVVRQLAEHRQSRSDIDAGHAGSCGPGLPAPTVKATPVPGSNESP